MSLPNENYSQKLTNSWTSYAPNLHGFKGAGSKVDGVDVGLISARRSDSSDLPSGWAQDWEALVPDLVQSTPSQKLTVEWPNRVTVEAGNVIEVISHLIPR